MISKMFTVYDSKVGAYLSPFYCKSKGEAIRSFIEISNDVQSQIGKYPEDFTLFELGEFDDFSARITQYDAAVSLGCAVEFVRAVSMQAQSAS